MLDVIKIKQIQEFKKLNLNEEALPFFISSHILENKIKNGSSLCVFQSKEYNCIYILTLTYKFSIFTLGQFEYPPVTLTGERLNKNEEQLFLNDVLIYIKKNNICDKILCPPLIDIYYSFPTLNNIKVCRFGNLVIDLENKSFAQIFEGFKSTYRSEIRKAEKEATKYETSPDLVNAFYDLYSQLMKREQKNIEPKSFFSSLINSNNVICAACSYNNNFEGALLVPYTKFMAYYLYGASALETKLIGSNKFLQAETIKLLIEKGVKKYSLGGYRLGEKGISSKIVGIQEYKKRFGAEILNGYLWKADLTYKAFLYNFIFKTYSVIRYRRIFTDIIDQSEEVKHNGEK